MAVFDKIATSSTELPLLNAPNPKEKGKIGWWEMCAYPHAVLQYFFKFVFDPPLDDKKEAKARLNPLSHPVCKLLGGTDVSACLLPSAEATFPWAWLPLPAARVGVKYHLCARPTRRCHRSR